MLEGKTIGNLVVGTKIGQGSFGEIYVARDSTDNKMCALKVEPKTSQRKILDFEISIFKLISPNLYFPLYYSSGKTDDSTWLAMELLGPSLSSVVKRIESHHLSFSTGIRVVTFIFEAIQKIHEFGIIHRDIKPSNVLLRRSNEMPIALIDFGLSRFYIDKNKKHLPPREHPGFRGTAIYASPNAHIHQELSRRDDLISWYYLTIDLMIGLPWKRAESRAEILHMKRRLQVGEIGSQIAPQFSTIWSMISILNYEDCPDYDKIKELLREAKEEHGVKDTDKWDWHPQILFMGNCEDDTKQIEDLKKNWSSFTSDTTIPDEIEAPKRYKYDDPLINKSSQNTPNCCCVLC
ncbi:CK1 family protein kinase [Histomonas meleagridis]|uniref:CK1 family protein kinase n=1 Tax=Histomonas meleagridis TaxID=135588 RepID=UPI003559C45E|nr:CK1 family protein kinase [Histomonas meleagridis]KAH0798788.1 CK1 family protein kinase [Histomonas meleagridis]